jgi:hypothetical protein
MTFSDKRQQGEEHRFEETWKQHNCLVFCIVKECPKKKTRIESDGDELQKPRNFNCSSALFLFQPPPPSPALILFFPIFGPTRMGHGICTKSSLFYCSGGDDMTRIRQAKARQDKTRQDKTRQDKTRQDKTRQRQRQRQDKTRQDKARQDKTGGKEGVRKGVSVKRSSQTRQPFSL